MGSYLQNKSQLDDYELANELGIPRLSITELEDFIGITQGHTDFLVDLLQFESPVETLHKLYAGNLEILASANNSPHKNLALEYMAKAYLQYLKILRSNET